MEEKVLLNATLVFLVRNRGAQVLLALKTKKIGAGCWNGYGGGIEPGEDPREAAAREFQEESGAVVSPRDLEKVSVVDFHNTKTDGMVFICRVHVYMAHVWQGEPKETEEMAQPTWFNSSDLPLSQMMPADRSWLPPILKGKKIRASAVYSPFQKELLGPVEVHEVSSLE